MRAVVPKSAASVNFELSLVTSSLSILLTTAEVFLCRGILSMSYVVECILIAVVGAVDIICVLIAFISFIRMLECIMDVQEMNMKLESSMLAEIIKQRRDKDNV